jgi:hypothetical protein
MRHPQLRRSSYRPLTGPCRLCPSHPLHWRFKPRHICSHLQQPLQTAALHCEVVLQGFLSNTDTAWLQRSLTSPAAAHRHTTQHTSQHIGRTPSMGRSSRPGPFRPATGCCASTPPPLDPNARPRTATSIKHHGSEVTLEHCFTPSPPTHTHTHSPV